MSEKNKPNAACAQCQTPIYRHPCKLARNKHHYCSRACLYKSMVTLVSTTCCGCGAAILKTPSCLANTKRPCCSKACVYRVTNTGRVTTHGYRRQWIGGRSQLEHRRIMEEHLGRRLLTSEHAHHINGDKLDNRLENLEVMSASEHQRHHNNERVYRLSWDIDEATRLRASGMSWANVSRKFGLTRQAVQMVFVGRGLPDPLKDANQD